MVLLLSVLLLVLLCLAGIFYLEPDGISGILRWVLGGAAMLMSIWLLWLVIVLSQAGASA